MYADDTSIYHSPKDITQLNPALNEELWRLDRWLMDNKLSLNVAKTRSMLITMKQKKKHLSASNQALEPSIREENIEVIKSVTEKASRAIGFRKFAKHFLPEAIVKTLCTSIVESHFQYCCSVWGCCNSTDILQLQRLQNRAAHIVANSHSDAPSKPLILSLGLKTIQELINSQVNLTVFKCLKNIAPKYLCDIFNKIHR